MAGKRTFVAGEVLTASNINSFLMDQVVAVFDDSSARSSAIPSPDEGNVTYLKDEDRISFYDGSEWLPVSGGFTASTAITATDSSWTVPALASTIVKVTVVGGGGGGGGFNFSGGYGGTGGTSSFACTAGTVTALGGRGGSNVPPPTDNYTQGVDGRNGLTAGNHGTGGAVTLESQFNMTGSSGSGGEVRVAYLDLDGVSTANVTIGGGGAGNTGNPTGGEGGNGEVIVEYVAG